MSFQIRDARLPEEVPQLHEFILGSQHFESAIEPNRRLDRQVARDYFTALEKEVRTNTGKVLVATRDEGPLAGWVVVHLLEDDVFVIDEERTYAYISELYIAEAERGKGIGRALIAACEDWARTQGLKVMQIGVLPGNHRAKAIYERAGYESYAIQLRKYLSTN
jgi:ribosomal protein S18 acetylase RimI-like enzyme